MVAINDPFMPLVYMVNQLQYDSVYGRFNGIIAMSEERSQALVLATESAPITSCCRISDARSHFNASREEFAADKSRYGSIYHGVASKFSLGTRQSSFFRERFIQHCREFHARADVVRCSGNITGETTAMTHEEAEIPPPVSRPSSRQTCVF